VQWHIALCFGARPNNTMSCSDCSGLWQAVGPCPPPPAHPADSINWAQGNQSRLGHAELASTRLVPAARRTHGANSRANNTLFSCSNITVQTPHGGRGVWGSTVISPRDAVMRRSSPMALMLGDAQAPSARSTTLRER
jgi:hypothetical protein